MTQVTYCFGIFGRLSFKPSQIGRKEVGKGSALATFIRVLEGEEGECQAGQLEGGRVLEGRLRRWQGFEGG